MTTQQEEMMTALQLADVNKAHYRQMTIGQKELLTVREVANYLRVDDTTVRRWIKSGALEAITLPHARKRQAYRIRRSTLEVLLGREPA